MDWTCPDAWYRIPNTFLHIQLYQISRGHSMLTQKIGKFDASLILYHNMIIKEKFISIFPL